MGRIPSLWNARWTGGMSVKLDAADGGFVINVFVTKRQFSELSPALSENVGSGAYPP